MTEAMAPADDSLALRPATPDDVPTILALIRELATFEKEPDAVVATEAGLRAHLFGARPMAEVVMADWDGVPVGFALFFHNFSTWEGRPGLYLEDLFVRPAWRGRSIGQRLLIHLAGIARSRDCARFEWIVLDWNVDAFRFYRRLGAEPLDGWTVFRVDGAALDRLADAEPPT
ncbi:MAG: GNAT family N-acetyltransferase [Acidobacteriota bacterium]